MDDLLPHALLRCRLAAVSLLSAFVLAACGPGTGGTGTGPTQGAMGSSLWFEGDWARQASQADAQAEFDDGRIRVRQGCVVAEFEGRWNPSPAGEVQVPVQVTAGPAGAPGNAPAPAATLSATAVSDEVLRVTVIDGAGRTVIGPLELQRQPEEGGSARPPSGAAPEGCATSAATKDRLASR